MIGFIIIVFIHGTDRSSAVGTPLGLRIQEVFEEVLLFEVLHLLVAVPCANYKTFNVKEKTWEKKRATAVSSSSM